MSDLLAERRWELSEALESAFNEEFTKSFRKKIENVLYESVESLEYHAKSDLCSNLSGHVKRMAEEAIEAMLRGDDETMRRRLQCNEGCWTGRDREHPVIHGKLFETGALELRKRIVEAHSDLLKNERILDLEDQVKSLVNQVNKVNAERDSMWERLRGYER